MTCMVCMTYRIYTAYIMYIRIYIWVCTGNWNPLTVLENNTMVPKSFCCDMQKPIWHYNYRLSEIESTQPARTFATPLSGTGVCLAFRDAPGMHLGTQRTCAAPEQGPLQVWYPCLPQQASTPASICTAQE